MQWIDKKLLFKCSFLTDVLSKNNKKKITYVLKSLNDWVQRNYSSCLATLLFISFFCLLVSFVWLVGFSWAFCLFLIFHPDEWDWFTQNWFHNRDGYTGWAVPKKSFLTLLLCQNAIWHCCRDKCPLGTRVQTHLNLWPTADLNSSWHLNILREILKCNSAPPSSEQLISALP